MRRLRLDRRDPRRCSRRCRTRAGERSEGPGGRPAAVLDLRPRRGSGGRRDVGGAPAPAADRQGVRLAQALLRLEKQTLGTFLSEHPLSEVRDASALASTARSRTSRWRPTGVGDDRGLVTERKKVRTKRGDEMMFATLDDLEGQVELLVFNSAYAATASRIEIDRVSSWCVAGSTTRSAARRSSWSRRQRRSSRRPSVRGRAPTQPPSMTAPSSCKSTPRTSRRRCSEAPPGALLPGRVQGAREDAGPAPAPASSGSDASTELATSHGELARPARLVAQPARAPRPGFPYHKRAASTTFRPPFTAVTRSS